MSDKFKKYGDGLNNMNPLVIMASVFDPQNKMKFASLCFDQLYGKDTLEIQHLYASVSSAMTRLYEEYSSRLSKPVDNETPTDAESALMWFSDDEEDDYERMDSIYNKMVGLSTSDDDCCELHIYFTEKTEVRVENTLGMTYNVLSWWRTNSCKFPILSEVARDVLENQFSLVALEPAFSTSGQLLDPYKSCLTPYTVEVLLCT